VQTPVTSRPQNRKILIRGKENVMAMTDAERQAKLRERRDVELDRLKVFEAAALSGGLAALSAYVPAASDAELKTALDLLKTEIDARADIAWSSMPADRRYPNNKLFGRF
jgi:hypothetical protein